MVRALIKRSFFGKGNCLSFLLYDNKTVMFHFGVEQEGSWRWKKVKMNDIELGEILSVLQGRRSDVSFFHQFKAEGRVSTTQIWVSCKVEDKGRTCFIRVKELSKSLNEGEQAVLEALIKHSLVRMNLEI